MEADIGTQQDTSVSHQNTITSPIEFGDIVTIVRDPRHLLGKRFHAGGSKSAEVKLSMGFAVQRAVPTAEAMVFGRQHHNKGGVQ
jgi:hypothetical protein